MQAIANSLMQWTGGAEGGDQGGVMGALAGRMREVFGAGGGEGGTDEERNEVMQQVSPSSSSGRYCTSDRIDRVLGLTSR